MTGELPNLATLLTRQGQISASLRQATVQSVQVFTLTLRLGGGVTDVANIRYLDSYLPLVGDTVWLLQSGTDLLVLGKVGSGGIPSIGTHTDAITYAGSTAAGTSTATLVTKTLTTGLTTTLVICRSNWDLDFTVTGTSFVNGYLRLDGGSDVFTCAEQDFAVHRQPSLRGRDVVLVMSGTGNHTIDMRYNKNNAGGTCNISNNTRTDFEGFW